ncbi:hypothetical protein N7456_000426 [Penicillium angulare]|uniref:Uncharacterized protein n=1 Tax=Penicillium angulare TaxID=116970 RepID=A0A9W9GDH9_9EURO|nr:hypothetical protein N7456_000426 [Penicillium angulare]
MWRIFKKVSPVKEKGRFLNPPPPKIPARQKTLSDTIERLQPPRFCLRSTQSSYRSYDAYEIKALSSWAFVPNLPSLVGS